MEKRRSACRGYTLLELLVAMSLVLTIMAWAGPAMSEILLSIRMKSGAQAIFDTLELARSEAVKRNGRVVICKSASGEACEREAAWEQGWIVFQDLNNNGLRDPGEATLHREPALPPTLRVRGNMPVQDYVSYTAYGRSKLASGAFQAGTFTVCTHSGRSTEARQVIINSAGRPRMSKAGPSSCTA